MHVGLFGSTRKFITCEITYLLGNLQIFRVLRRLRFIKDEFKLKRSGLHKLNDIGISSKSFKDLGNLRDVFWDTKLRIIEFSFHTKSSANEEMEDVVKKEIFKRYNSGITPLKPTEIDKAFYFDDDLNSY